jgi:hypothetical protein
MGLVDTTEWSKALPPDSTMLVREKGCDCGTGIGSRAPDSDAPASLEPEITRLRRKGWSESRIERWRQEKNAPRDNTHAALTSKAQRGVDAWLSILRECAETRGVQSVGLIVRSFDGSVSKDVPKELPVRDTGHSELAQCALTQLPYDTLLRVHR